MAISKIIIFLMISIIINIFFMFFSMFFLKFSWQRFIAKFMKNPVLVTIISDAHRFKTRVYDRKGKLTLTTDKGEERVFDEKFSFIDFGIPHYFFLNDSAQPVDLNNPNKVIDTETMDKIITLAKASGVVDAFNQLLHKLMIPLIIGLVIIGIIVIMGVVFSNNAAKSGELCIVLIKQLANQTVSLRG